MARELTAQRVGLELPDLVAVEHLVRVRVRGRGRVRVRVRAKVRVRVEVRVSVAVEHELAQLQQAAEAVDAHELVALQVEHLELQQPVQPQRRQVGDLVVPQLQHLERDERADARLQARPRTASRRRSRVGLGIGTRCCGEAERLQRGRCTAAAAAADGRAEPVRRGRGDEVVVEPEHGERGQARQVGGGREQVRVEVELAQVDELGALQVRVGLGLGLGAYGLGLRVTVKGVGLGLGLGPVPTLPLTLVPTLPLTLACSPSSSRIFDRDRSSSRTCSQKLCPTFSTSASTVSRPA